MLLYSSRSGRIGRQARVVAVEQAWLTAALAVLAGPARSAGEAATAAIAHVRRDVDALVAADRLGGGTANGAAAGASSRADRAPVPGVGLEVAPLQAAASTTKPSPRNQANDRFTTPGTTTNKISIMVPAIRDADAAPKSRVSQMLRASTGIRGSSACHDWSSRMQGVPDLRRRSGRAGRRVKRG
jgi:hypothetical protein